MSEPKLLTRKQVVNTQRNILFSDPFEKLALTALAAFDESGVLWRSRAEQLECERDEARKSLEMLRLSIDGGLQGAANAHQLIAAQAQEIERLTDHLESCTKVLREDRDRWRTVALGERKRIANLVRDMPCVFEWIAGAIEAIPPPDLPEQKEPQG